MSMSEQQQDDEKTTTTSTIQIFDRILSPDSTMYDVLGVPHHDVDNTTLRKAYLATSVKVHPDKNPPHLHETATLAFQKVALAYQVLSNETSRAEYDEKLRQNDGTHHQDDYFSHDHSSSNGETYYHYSAPSYQDAMFVFASVVGSAMASRGVSSASMMTDAAQCLYWAQQWLNKNQSETERGDASSSSTTTAAMLTLGSSLKVASSAARMMGFRKSADALERTGTATQAAGAASMVAEQMGVDVSKVLQNERVQRLSSKMSKSVKKVLQQKKKHDDNEDGASS